MQLNVCFWCQLKAQSKTKVITSQDLCFNLTWQSFVRCYSGEIFWSCFYFFLNFFIVTQVTHLKSNLGYGQRPVLHKELLAWPALMDQRTLKSTQKKGKCQNFEFFQPWSWRYETLVEIETDTMVRFRCGVPIEFLGTQTFCFLYKLERKMWKITS